MSRRPRSSRLRWRVWLLVAGLAAAAGAGCGAPGPVIAPGCNPLVGDDCLTPYPSSFFEVPDPSTPTGLRVAVPDVAMPLQSSGVRLSAARLNRLDGFSPSTPLVVYFKAGVAAAELPGETDLGASLDASARVQLYDLDSGERLPLWAELDLIADPTIAERQGLLIHPARRLLPQHHYGVALVALDDAAGHPLPTRPAAPALAAFLAAHGVTGDRLTLAWDFHTASDGAATSSLLHMRELTLARLAQGDLGYQVSQQIDAAAGDTVLLRTFTATIDVPSFLADAGGRAPLVVDDRGLPQLRGIDQVAVSVVVPRCAATHGGPIPLVIFGSGLFLGAKETLGYRAWQSVANDVCAVYAGTDWLGLAGADLPLAGEAAAADLNLLFVITDRLQQAQMNALVMTRLLLSRIKDDAALSTSGTPILDGSQVYYYGISNGGIQGAAFLALSPDVERGVLNVPGGEWSLMISRSTDFVSLKVLLTHLLPDPLDRQLAFALSQSEWDHSDAATWASHVIRQPIAGQAPKRVLVQESIGDAQVPNVATRILVRELGIPLLTPAITPVYGVDEQPGPLDSAYTQWDSNLMPRPPVGDIALPADNGAHNFIWPTALSAAQLRAFYKPDGQVTQVCPNQCTF